MFSVDCFALRNVIGVENAFGDEEYEDYLFGPGGLDPGSDWLTLLTHCIDCFFFSGVKRKGRLVHNNAVVEDCQQLPLNEVQEGVAAFRSFSDQWTIA